MKSRRVKAHCAIAVTLPLVLSGCGLSAPDCASESIITTVKNLARGRLPRNDAQLNYFIDFEKTSFSIKAIRTIGSNKKAFSCKASLLVQLEPRDEIKKLKQTNPTEYLVLVPSGADRPPERTLDITYQVELTDDKTQVYVTVQGLTF